MLKQTYERLWLHRLALATYTLCAILATSADTRAETLYIATSSNVFRLYDANQDGDFLDYQEQRLFATGPSMNLRGLCHADNHLVTLDLTSNALIRIEDINGDGDALDAGEVCTFASIPDTPLPSPLSSLLSLPEGGLLVSRRDIGTLHRVEDLNGDGDASDAGEITPIASGLTSPVAIARRPDGAILVAQEDAVHTIRILQDHNGDGDFFDFAENLSYTNTLSPGFDLLATSNDLAFFSQPTTHTILRLQDLTGDDDCLDVAEITPYLTAMTAPCHLAMEAGGSLYVLDATSGNPLYRVSDLNQDGDALDAGEIVLVGHLPAAGTGMACEIAQTSCTPGDFNGDEQVDMADLQPFVAVLVGGMPAPDLCTADLNQDGAINGFDVQWMVWRLTSG